MDTDIPHTKVTIIDNKTLKILEEYTYSKLVNARALAEKKHNGKIVHSEKLQLVYEKYWIEINEAI